MGRVRVAAYLVSSAWSVALLIAGIHLPGAEAKVLGYVPIGVVMIFGVFDQWAWRWPLVRRLVRRPDLNGTWRGELTSMWPNAKGVEVAHDPKPVFLAIKQSYLSVSVRLMTDESKSNSYAATLQVVPSGGFAVYYHFANAPRLQMRDRSRPHDGAAKLEVDGLTAARHSGEYWTDRRSRGTWTAERFTPRYLGSYEAASEASK